MKMPKIVNAIISPSWVSSPKVTTGVVIFYSLPFVPCQASSSNAPYKENLPGWLPSTSLPISILSNFSVSGSSRTKAEEGKTCRFIFKENFTSSCYKLTNERLSAVTWLQYTASADKGSQRIPVKTSTSDQFPMSHRKQLPTVQCLSRLVPQQAPLSTQGAPPSPLALTSYVKTAVLPLSWGS